MKNESRSGIREWAADGATVIIAILAVALAGSVVFEGAAVRGGDARRDTDDRDIKGWEQLASSGNRIGPAEARVLVVEFVDYECPFCQRAERVLRALRQAYPEDVAVIYRHLPLPSHPNAYPAARLAECASEQNRFTAVHRLLINAIELASLSAGAVARHAELPDSTGFVECAARTGVVQQIEIDLALAHELGVQGVPAVIVEGTLLGTAADSVRLFDHVRQVLEEKHK